MDLFDEINNLHSIFLVNVEEPRDNELIINVKAASVSKTREYIKVSDKEIGPARRVSMDGLGKLYAFYFQTYAVYSIYDESFLLFNKEDKYIGRHFCEFSKSGFLDHVRSNSTIEFVFEDKLKHYALYCQNHIIHIASLDSPIISEVTDVSL